MGGNPLDQPVRRFAEEIEESFCSSEAFEAIVLNLVDELLVSDPFILDLPLSQWAP